MYFIQYEIRPVPGSELFAEVGGAVANCFVAASSEEKAKELALLNFKDNGWEVVTIEDGPFLVYREHYLDNLEWLEWFDQAVQDGEYYVFHEWPPESQEDDQVH